MEEIYNELCVLSCALANAYRASISYRDIKAAKIFVVGRSSGPPRTLDIKYALPKVSQKNPVYLVSQVEKDAFFDDYAGASLVPNLRSVAAYWLGNRNGHDHFLILWNPAQSFFEDDHSVHAIDHIVAILRDLLKNEVNIQQSASHDGFHESPIEKRLLKKSAEPAVGRFLFDTLVTKQRLLARNGCAYVGLRQWRKSIKPYQVSALAALKNSGDDSFENDIAIEMVAAIKRVYGDAFKYVVPIPGGSSGLTHSLSVKLAERIAKLLRAEFANVLVAAPVPKGSSHPAKSASLKPYEINGKISGNVLVVDDVATSGRHIELATQALRPLTTFCTSIVWIAD